MVYKVYRFVNKDNQFFNNLWMILSVSAYGSIIQNCDI